MTRSIAAALLLLATASAAAAQTPPNPCSAQSQARFSAVVRNEILEYADSVVGIYITRDSLRWRCVLNKTGAVPPSPPPSPPTAPPPSPPTAPPAGDPAPAPGDVVLVDMRAGGAQDLQTCTTASCARGRYALQVGAVGFTANMDGAGRRALVLPWTKFNGQATCTGNVGSEQDMAIGLMPNIAGPADVYLQYKIWMGRTATGGGTGLVGAYMNASNVAGAPGGHKWFAWFRSASGSPEARLTGQQSPTLWKLITTAYTGYSGPAAVADGSIGEVHLFGSDVPTGAWNPDQHLNQVNTLTFRIRSETAANARNGLMEAWANGALVQSRTGLYTATYGFYELQVGGPTWICPPQDQTAYVWDLVIWRRP